MKARLFFLSLGMLGAAALCGATLEQAKAVFNKGDYAKALPMMQEQYKKAPKNGSVNHWLGVCLYETGEARQSLKYFEYAATRKVAEAHRYLALIAYDNYDFEAAQEHLDDYADALSRAKKSTDAVEPLRNSIACAQTMLDHVEKIVIIDSTSVDKADILMAINMSASCGTLGYANALPEEIARSGATFVHTMELGSKVVWSQPGEGSTSEIWESTRLIQGWDNPVRLDNNFGLGGNVAYPFLLQDGVTLYFASDGESSMGGYDIFMTRKDIETGEYYKPQNVGMPYNSPYDDFLLAIDEEKNVGWWVTDRNHIPGKLTIYTFIPNPSRINYSADDPSVASRARVTSYRDTWGDSDYSQMAQEIKEPSTNALYSVTEFAFNVCNGVVYHTFDDFKTPSAAKMMEELIVMQRHYKSNRERLTSLRHKYANASKPDKLSLKSSILQLETSLEKTRSDIFDTENAIRKIELN